MHSKHQIIPLKKIYLVGDGFNIEGGDLAKHLLEGQEWANLCMPLDLPFLNKKTLQQITADNNFTLKEMSIVDYNETNVNLTMLLIIDYCRSYQKNILIYIHRGTSSLKYINMLITILYKYYSTFIDQGNFVFEIDGKILIRFMYGYDTKEFTNYPGYDILFSISLMGGLNHQYGSGTLTLPRSFTPFDKDNRIIDCTKTVICNNYLLKILDDVLNVNQHNFFEVIDECKSENPNKQFIAQTITKDMFKIVDVLQINELYNPSESEFEDSVIILK